MKFIPIIFLFSLVLTCAGQQNVYPLRWGIHGNLILSGETDICTFGASVLFRDQHLLNLGIGMDHPHFHDLGKRPAVSFEYDFCFRKISRHSFMPFLAVSSDFFSWKSDHPPSDGRAWSSVAIHSVYGEAGAGFLVRFLRNFTAKFSLNYIVLRYRVVEWREYESVPAVIRGSELRFNNSMFESRYIVKFGVGYLLR